jgi:hypothetical protein
MYGFKNYITEEKELPEITEEELNSMVDSLTWDDIEDLYDDDEFENEELKEGISAVERMKRGQRMKARKMILAMQRKVKLKRTSPLGVLKRRSQVAARKLITKKLLRNRDKTKLSAAEKNMIEIRAKRILKVYKNLPTRLMPKIRELERTRLSGAK